ncbi:SDR family NAD(P)-dependent oxidoreductase [Aestuariibaculum lutulentum]|uniref:SDR family oxidoreductase n=1 Tax=Aestuariibaculum lutulentum TaxID=2920935 RepID=A0ABS9RKQ6_9FLAO|nr:SDR family oxidoreductase [Aestuariibaculum lutulentum]MCH4553531.1 SDR family oxidoreductase [Aestuariibaculum lutulentum]
MKSVIIIGGSKGIGNAILNQLIDTHKVINLSRTAPSQQHTNLLHKNYNVLTDELPEIEAADALIYCPGSINLKPFSRLSIDEFKADFEINVLGAIKVIQHYLPVLRQGKNPSILLFSTVATKLGMPFHTSVAMAKSGVEGLVKSLGAELAPNVRINGIAPSVTDTELASKLLRNEKMIETITERHPLKKLLKPEEVAELAVFLISDKALAMSGQIFQMDNGIVTFKI